MQIGDDSIILLIQLSAMTRKLDRLGSVISSPYLVHRFSIGTQSKLSDIFTSLMTEDGAQRVIESPDIVKLGVNIRGEPGICTFFLVL